jgi:hypothetical protein
MVYWEEKTPEIGDTVKVHFNYDLVGYTTKIGVFIGISADGLYKVDFGDRIMYLDKNSTFEVKL